MSSVERLLFTPQEAALALGYDVQTIRNKIYNGEIPTVRIPANTGERRISADWLREEIARQTEAAKWRVAK